MTTKAMEELQKEVCRKKKEIGICFKRRLLKQWKKAATEPTFDISTPAFD